MRIRDAVQYAATIDEFVERLNKGNNGGFYANATAHRRPQHRRDRPLRAGPGDPRASRRTFDGACFGFRNAVFDRAHSQPGVQRTTFVASTTRVQQTGAVASAGWSSLRSVLPARSTWKS
ncbi:MAG: hypothetical protein ACLTDR_02485 [Adlercreutzia equolifaciens]